MLATVNGVAAIIRCDAVEHRRCRSVEPFNTTCAALARLSRYCRIECSTLREVATRLAAAANEFDGVCVSIGVTSGGRKARAMMLCST